MNKNFNIKGFTLIELIIVIAVIALLAAATFVAVDPAKRIGQARDAQRWADVTAIADAITQYVADNTGTYPTSTVTNGSFYLIMASSTTGVVGFTCQNVAEEAGLGVQLDSKLIPAYLPTMPLDPAGTGTYGAVATGYYFSKNSAGRTIIGACKESDYATASIKVQR